MVQLSAVALYARKLDGMHMSNILCSMSAGLFGGVARGKKHVLNLSAGKTAWYCTRRPGRCSMAVDGSGKQTKGGLSLLLDALRKREDGSKLISSQGYPHLTTSLDERDQDRQLAHGCATKRIELLLGRGAPPHGRLACHMSHLQLMKISKFNAFGDIRHVDRRHLFRGTAVL